MEIQSELIDKIVALTVGVIMGYLWGVIGLIKAGTIDWDKYKELTSQPFNPE